MRRRGVGLAWFAAIASLAASLNVPLVGSAQFHRFAAPAAWVAPIETPSPATAPTGGADASTWVQLLDRQINISETGDDFYRHIAVKVLNSVGVDDYSQIDLAVDPAFQTLDIHRLRVVRAGEIIDQQKLARITELPQETELRNRIYNGRYNIDIVLSDVRAGDVIEYSYTVHSRELIFPGSFYARLDTGWTVPVDHQRIRVRAPVTRQIAFLSSDGSPVPSPVMAGDRHEFVIEWHDLAAVPALSSTPGWYSVWPYLEIGDRGSWTEVARAVEPLFRLPTELGPGVAAALDAIRGSGGTPAAQALRALQFVQEEIRYTSIAIAPGSYAPAPTELVIKRRFGDCKDKSLLLATLLDRLGVEAQVALVHSFRGRALDGSLPTPYAFDHAIVRAVIDGGVHWLDPTAATQYEPLSISHHPDYERALPVGSSSPGLEVIPLPASDMRRREIATTLDLSAGLKAEGLMEVTTRYEGAYADEMRPTLSSVNSEQRQSDYESYAAHYYPGARSLAPVEILDDRTDNVVTVRERYRLENAFAPAGEEVLELVLHADELYNYAQALGAAGRRVPLALEYPLRIKQRVVAKLPEDWALRADDVAVDNPAFRYRSKVGYTGRTLTLEYEYEALAASVAPEDIAKYEADRARVYDDLGYRLTRADPAVNSGSPGGVAPLPMLGLLFAFLLSIWAAVRWGYRYDPPGREAEPGSPAGIGGWLLLPALSMILTPLLSGAAVVAWLASIEAKAWYALPTVVNQGYAGTTHPVVLSIMALAVLQIVFAVLAAVLFFAKRTSAPRYFVALTWFVVVTDGAAVIWSLAAGFNKDLNATGVFSDVMRSIVSAFVWTAYMSSSKRVKATFVRRLAPSPSAIVPAPTVPAPPEPAS
jgi:transglutaminase-like putative cysteine protease